MKTCLVGRGRWGRNHERVIGDDLSDVVDPAICGAPSLREALPRCDAVVIAAPAALHAAMAIECLRAGKHVLVEKPMATSLLDAEAMYLASRETERVLMVGHLLHYHPSFERLMGLVERGDLGTLRHIYSHRLSFGTVREGEDAWWSFAPHDVSMILALAGKPPKKISSRGHALTQTQRADVSLTFLEFFGTGSGTGLLAHIHVSWLHPFKEHRLVVIGDAKMAVFDGVSGELAVHDKTTDGNATVAHATMFYRTPGGPDGEPLRRQYRAFCAAVEARQKGVVMVTPTDAKRGVEVVRVLRDATESMSADGEVRWGT